MGFRLYLPKTHQGVEPGFSLFKCTLYDSIYTRKDPAAQNNQQVLHDLHEKRLDSFSKHKSSQKNPIEDTRTKNQSFVQNQ